MRQSLQRIHNEALRGWEFHAGLVWYLDQRPGHPIQEAFGEPCCLVAASHVDNGLGAAEVLPEGTAQQADVALLFLVALVDVVVSAQALDATLVMIGTLLVTALDPAHAGGMPEVICEI